MSSVWGMILQWGSTIKVNIELPVTVTTRQSWYDWKIVESDVKPEQTNKFISDIPSCIAEVVKQKGLEHITVDDLVAEITPKGRGMFRKNPTYGRFWAIDPMIGSWGHLPALVIMCTWASKIE